MICLLKEEVGKSQSDEYFKVMCLCLKEYVNGENNLKVLMTL